MKVWQEKQKELRNIYLNDINKELNAARQKNNGRIPYGLVTTIIEQSKQTMPWLSRNIINKSFNKFITEKKFELYNTAEQS